ncbi:MAG TPA: LysE family transporter [Micromonosporaceae bacterium]|jgi:arginine exporter protein ArgO|nr:LysE family transporter [Micromonosporaceae bacterium]
MGDALVSGLLAGYGVAIPVGAIAVLIIGLSAQVSLAVGAGAALGVAAADGIYALVAVLGGAALASVIRPVATPLRVVAAVVLFVIAGRIARNAWRHFHDPTRRVATPLLGTPSRAFAGLLGLTLLNPTTIVYFAALVLGQKSSGAATSAGASAVFVAAAFVASASWQLLLAAGGSALGRTLASDRGRLITAIVSAAVIVALAIRTLVG